MLTNFWVMSGTHMRLMIGEMKSWTRGVMSVFNLFKFMLSASVAFLQNYLLHVGSTGPTF